MYEKRKMLWCAEEDTQEKKIRPRKVYFSPAFVNPFSQRFRFSHPPHLLKPNILAMPAANISTKSPSPIAAGHLPTQFGLSAGVVRVAPHRLHLCECWLPSNVDSRSWSMLVNLAGCAGGITGETGEATHARKDLSCPAVPRIGNSKFKYANRNCARITHSDSYHAG